MIEGWVPEVDALTAEAVQVWVLSLPDVAAHEEFLMTLLNAEERQRAWRFHFAKDRQTFVGTRGVLRLLLGGYLGVSPAEIIFSYGAWGKPALAPGIPADGLEFNVSHSHHVALLAFGRSRAVGVDVEQIRSNLELDDLAARFFSPREVARLRMLAPDERMRAFFRCWTRKEAFLKAHGAGLALSLARFSVTLDPERAELVEALDRPEEVGRWRLMPLAVGAAYAAALAIAGQELPSLVMQDWVWPDETASRRGGGS